MKKIRVKSMVSMAAGVCLLASIAVQSAQATTYPNLVQVLERDGRFNTLLAALDAAGLKSTVETAGPLTVLAPTDAAFARLPAGTVESLLTNIPALTDILLYHVLGGRQYSWQLLATNTPVTLEGNAVVVLRDGLKVTINGNKVLQANRFAANGLVHVIDGVLLPPESDLPITSIVDVLRLDGRFNTLLAALDAAGLTDTVATGGIFTLFAPTDDAFAALPPGTVESLVTNVPELTKILLYHVLAGKTTSAQLLLAKTATTLEGSTLAASLKNCQVYVNDSRVINPNVKAPNGLIHVIDKVLLPPPPTPNLLDLLKADGRFTTLVTALELTGLGDVVATNGPFTVFAPTDAAFAALPSGALESLVADPDALKAVLLYHVVDGEKKALALLAQRVVPTLQGENVVVRLGWDGKVYVNRSQVIQANVDAANGIAHVINRVLLPPAQ
jgi:transforming growth factor-beta-induced protein